jgi:uncharacterized protein (TIGR00255 family)
MALSSMTGFARADGAAGPYGWTWEVRSVNAKGLELRLRLPAGWEAIETPLRARATAALARGSLFASLTIEREGGTPAVKINETVLAALLYNAREVAQRIAATPPSLDTLLQLKGVTEITEAEESAEERAAVEVAVLAGFDQALAALGEMRRHEGAALGRVLFARLDEIGALTRRAEESPGRQPEAVKARLAEQIALLLDGSARFDADRLHQEAILIAAKADVREELDRLAAHVAQARRLIEIGGAIGRRLDFLSQELNREANTLAAKANDLELTNIALELKTVVEQFREQVQNLE